MKKLSINTPEMKKLWDSSHTNLGHKQSPVIVCLFFFVFLYTGIGCTANAHSTVSKKCKW